MKRREGFVSNSSSCSFIITNLTNETKTLVDFVEENPQLLIKFKDEYGYNNDPEMTQENLLKSAKENDIEFSSKRRTQCTFGDEDGTLIGRVFDYILRDGGDSKSFSWEFDEFLR